MENLPPRLLGCFQAHASCQRGYKCKCLIQLRHLPCREGVWLAECPPHMEMWPSWLSPQVHPDLGGLPPIVPLLTVTKQRITGRVCLDPPVSPTKQVQDCCSRLHFLSCCVSFIQQMTVLTGTIPSSLKAKCTLLRSSTVKRERR